MVRVVTDFWLLDVVRVGNRTSSFGSLGIFGAAGWVECAETFVKLHSSTGDMFGIGSMMAGSYIRRGSYQAPHPGLSCSSMCSLASLVVPTDTFPISVCSLLPQLRARLLGVTPPALMVGVELFKASWPSDLEATEATLCRGRYMMH